MERDETRPLRITLRLLTVSSGMVDAVSFLGLGRVFTSNMTGNVLVLGMAAAGASGFSALACLVSLLGFLLGAALSSRLVHHMGIGRRWFLIESVAEAALIGAAAVVAQVTDASASSESRLLVIAILALAMGGRNAAVRLLAIPEMTTTVMTSTLTGLAIDSRIAGSSDPVERFRLAGLLAIVAGAFIGALLVINAGLALPLVVAAVGQLVVTVAFARSSGSRILDHGLGRETTSPGPARRDS